MRSLAPTATGEARSVASWVGMGGGYWGPGVAAGVIGGAVIAGAIIASRPRGYVVYPGYAEPVYDPGATGHRSHSMTVMVRVVGYTGSRCRSVRGMRPPPAVAGPPPPAYVEPPYK